LIAHVDCAIYLLPFFFEKLAIFSIAGADYGPPQISAPPFGPRHSPLSASSSEPQLQCRLGPMGLTFRAAQMHQSTLFSPVQCPPRCVGRPTLDSGHAEC